MMARASNMGRFLLWQLLAASMFIVIAFNTDSLSRSVSYFQSGWNNELSGRFQILPNKPPVGRLAMASEQGEGGGVGGSSGDAEGRGGGNGEVSEFRRRTPRRGGGGGRGGGAPPPPPPRRLPNLQSMDIGGLLGAEAGGEDCGPAPPPPPPTEADYARFRDLVQRMLLAEEEETAAAILSAEVDFLLNTDCGPLMTRLQEEVPPSDAEVVDNVYTYMLDFLQIAIDQTLDIQKRHQETLRRILEEAKKGEGPLEAAVGAAVRQGDLLFLEYLDGEAARLLREEQQTGSAPMLKIILTVREKFRAEYEKSLGVEVVTLSTVVQYDDPEERVLFLQKFGANSDKKTLQNFYKLVNHTLKEKESGKISGHDDYFEVMRHIKSVLDHYRIGLPSQ